MQFFVCFISYLTDSLFLQSDNLPCTPSLAGTRFLCKKSIFSSSYYKHFCNRTVRGLINAIIFKMLYFRIVRENSIMDFYFIYHELMYHNFRKVLLFTINNPEKSLFFLLNSRCNNEIITERSEGIAGIKKHPTAEIKKCSTTDIKKHCTTSFQKLSILQTKSLFSAVHAIQGVENRRQKRRTEL